MKEELFRFIREDIGVDADDIDGETSLFKSKMLDSMNITVLIAFLEETCAIKISAMDIVFENFDTVDNLVAFVNRKRGQNG